MRSSSQVFLATGLLSALFLGSSTHAYSANNRGSPQVKAYYPSYNFEAQPVSKIDWKFVAELVRAGGWTGFKNMVSQGIEMDWEYANG
ncbi:hypothetical protein PGT21_024393 [Puccinia graminis f. sp. tritici]|uniref:Uncharacterized protein n=1 Tax=Puccinia graminis f. sp. tritici TaxID=56615 RepID=A0A5B0M343_PUCGR|nr:hypothetical protein PGT21_024393 [Puccinia graminis f. sp. tritici]